MLNLNLIELRTLIELIDKIMALSLPYVCFLLTLSLSAQEFATFVCIMYNLIFEGSLILSSKIELLS